MIVSPHSHPLHQSNQCSTCQPEHGHPEQHCHQTIIFDSVRGHQKPHAKFLVFLLHVPV